MELLNSDEGLVSLKQESTYRKYMVCTYIYINVYIICSSGSKLGMVSNRVLRCLLSVEGFQLQMSQRQCRPVESQQKNTQYR